MPDYNQLSAQDAYGHFPASAGPVMGTGAVGTAAAGTIAPTTGAGSAPTVTFAAGQTANDTAGTFTLSPVTGGGGQSAGAVATVTYSNPQPSLPKAILVTIYDSANAAAIAAAATTITTQGFQVSVGVALTTAHAYLVSYEVVN
jgi:hypothetical protein